MIVKTGYDSAGNPAGAWLKLKDAKEPCVLLLLRAHGTAEGWNVSDEMDEAVMLPASWFSRMEDRIEALEAKMEPFLPVSEVKLASGVAEAMFGGQPTPGPVLERWVGRFDHLRSNATNVQLDQMVESFGSVEAAARAFEDGIKSEDIACYSCGEKNVLLGVTKRGEFCCKGCADTKGLQVQYSGTFSFDASGLEWVENPYLPEDYKKRLTSKYHRYVEVFEFEVEGLDLAGFKALVREKLQAVGDSLIAAWKEEHPDG